MVWERPFVLLFTANSHTMTDSSDSDTDTCSCRNIVVVLDFLPFPSFRSDWMAAEANALRRFVVEGESLRILGPNSTGVFGASELFEDQETHTLETMPQLTPNQVQRDMFRVWG